MPFISVIVLVLALASSLAWSSYSFESAPDQYEERQDRLQVHLLPEDHHREVRQADFIVKTTNSALVHIPTDPTGSESVGSSNNNRFITMVSSTAPPLPLPTLPQIRNWNQPEQTTQRPPSTTSVIPTRRPRPGGSRPRPPLVHNSTDPEVFESIGSSNNNKFTTTAPSGAPPLPPSISPQPPPKEPSRCAWAIIYCCSATIGYFSTDTNECFTHRGCTGVFWDNNPCSREFVKAAVASALNYYNK